MIKKDDFRMPDLKDAEVRRIVRSREGEIHLCRCCALDVITQGPTEAAARQNLTEAVTLFLESCAELGSRDEIFREMGFRDTPAGVFPPACCYSRRCPCRPEED